MTPPPGPAPPAVPALALAHLRLAEGGADVPPRHARRRGVAAVLAGLVLAVAPAALWTASARAADHPAATLPAKHGVEVEDDAGMG